MSHPCVVLELSIEAFDEIRAKLEAAGYHFHATSNGLVIDMHGIAVRSAAVEAKPLTYRDSPEDGEHD